MEAVKSAGGQKVSFVNTNNRGKWPKYSRLKVSYGGFVFPAFDFHKAYEDTDVFVSLAKLKQHVQAGVTGAVKNLFGMAPSSLYGNDAPNENSTAGRGPLHVPKRALPEGVPAELDHGIPPNDPFTRIPYVVVDIFGTRPIDLSVIDGIESNRMGEGPWNKHAEPIQPHLLLLGANPVCTDAICTAAMGFDPTVDHREFPFPGHNHLKIAAHAGFGTIAPERIEVRGLPLTKAVCPYNPKREPLSRSSGHGPNMSPA